MLGRVDQVLVARFRSRTVLKTLNRVSPPKVISWPPMIAAPSLSAVGRGGSWVHWLVAGLKRCTASV